MAQTGPVGQGELARMPYLEACLKVGASCTLTHWAHDMLPYWRARTYTWLHPLCSVTMQKTALPLHEVPLA